MLLQLLLVATVTDDFTPLVIYIEEAAQTLINVHTKPKRSSCLLLLYIIKHRYGAGVRGVSGVTVQKSDLRERRRRHR